MPAINNMLCILISDVVVLEARSWPRGASEQNFMALGLMALTLTVKVQALALALRAALTIFVSPSNSTPNKIKLEVTIIIMMIMMIRWICGAKLEDKISSAVFHQKLDLDEITAVLRTRRLRWYGHVQRATSCINSITRDRGRPRKTWSACVRNDLTICNLDGVNPLDRNSWRTSVRRCQVLPTPESGTTAAP